MLDDPVGYVANGGSANRIFFGAFLELLLIIANIGTAVVVYPILKRQNHILALGYVTARIVECAFILVGILAVLSIVTLSQPDAGGDEGAIAYTLAAPRTGRSSWGPVSSWVGATGSSSATCTLQGLATLPEFIWELGLGIYATLIGFRGVADPSGGNRPGPADDLIAGVSRPPRGGSRRPTR